MTVLGNSVEISDDDCQSTEILLNELIHYSIDIFILFTSLFFLLIQVFTKTVSESTHIVILECQSNSFQILVISDKVSEIHLILNHILLLLYFFILELLSDIFENVEVTVIGSCAYFLSISEDINGPHFALVDIIDIDHHLFL